MNYRKDFETCFEWIEKHLKDEVTVGSMAAEMGYSIYHFCRIFYLYQGKTPMEYVLNRRLQAALTDVWNGKKIYEAALDYGFETSGGFTRAVKKKYGKAPSKLKRVDWNTEIWNDVDSIPLLMEIKEIGELDICGHGEQRDFQSEHYEDEMIAYWTEFEEKELEQQLYDSIDPHKHGEFGMIIRDGDDSGKHRYMLGVLENKKKSSDQWITHSISGGTYLVVTTPPVNMKVEEEALAKMVRKVWKYLFLQWSERVEYEFDETREAFEYYDERCHFCSDAVMEIYVPIRFIKER